MNTQEAREIVHNLIRGSQEIDQMRKEVDCVVKMVIGFVALHCPYWQDYGKKRFFIPNSQYCWEFFMQPRPEKLEVRFLYVHKDENLSPEPLYSYFAGGEYPIHLNSVKMVYDALPVFVEGIVKIFPVIQTRWKPLLDAAETPEK